MKTKLMAAIAALSILPYWAKAQTDMEMSDMFGELNDQIQGSTSIISTICYSIAGICFLVGLIQVSTKIYQGREVGKDIGLYFGGIAIFCIGGYICQKFFE